MYKSSEVSGAIYSYTIELKNMLSNIQKRKFTRNKTMYVGENSK